jgi:hypothetical protein
MLGKTHNAPPGWERLSWALWKCIYAYSGFDNVDEALWALAITLRAFLLKEQL